VTRSDATLVGRTIGEYELVAELGGGSLGMVYEGRHPLIGKRVAVKVLRTGSAVEDAHVSRFLAEARAVNAIGHRGIVDIFAFGQLADGSRYLVMDFLSGVTFQELIERRAPLPVGEVLQWLDEILEALGAAHRINIVHGDVKPSNLFLVDGGAGRPYVKVLDFGAAKVAGEPAVSGAGDEAPPTQRPPTAVAPGVDLYSLGLVFFELLTGRRAFAADAQSRPGGGDREQAPPLRAVELNPLVPEEVDTLVQWMLAPKAEQRPPSAEALRARLEGVRASLPCAGPAPAGVAGPPSRSRQREANENVPVPVRVTGSATDLAAVQSAPLRRPMALRTRVLAAGLLLSLAALGASLWQRPSSEARAAAGTPTRSPRVRRAPAAPSPAPQSRVRVYLQIEEPAQDAAMSGIGSIRGWSVAPEGIDRVELFVDGKPYGEAAFGAEKPQVAERFPRYAEARRSGFVRTFNYSELDPGGHTLVARAVAKDGSSREVKAAFSVVRFHSSFLARAQAVNLDHATLAGVGSTIAIQKLLVEGVAYDAVLSWSPSLQDFALTRLEERTQPGSPPRRRRDPARSGDALPGLGVGFAPAVASAPSPRASGFARPFLSAPDAVELDGASFSRAGHAFTVHGLLAEGKPSDVRIAWDTRSQRFVIADVKPAAMARQVSVGAQPP
jgi:tRNA A-37 threonylcarbamoyl transferase component Bud32